MTSVLTEQNVAEVATFLEDRTGTDLQAVVGYWQGGDVTIVYIRDDLKADADEVFDEDWMREVLLESFAQTVKEEAFQLGSLECTTQFFEEATILNVHHQTGSGIAAFFDPDSVEISRSFIEACRDIASSGENRLLTPEVL